MRNLTPSLNRDLFFLKPRLLTAFSKDVEPPGVTPQICLSGFLRREFGDLVASD
jgi:hypothetical protein